MNKQSTILLNDCSQTSRGRRPTSSASLATSFGLWAMSMYGTGRLRSRGRRRRRHVLAVTRASTHRSVVHHVCHRQRTNAWRAHTQSINQPYSLMKLRHAQTSQDRCDVDCNVLCGLEVNVADETSAGGAGGVGDGVDAAVNHNTALLQPLTTHKQRLANRHNNNVRRRQQRVKPNITRAKATCTKPSIT